MVGGTAWRRIRTVGAIQPTRASQPGDVMNIRVVAAGALLIVLAGAFFLYMSGIAARSTDPAEMMRTVGMVSGGAAGIGAAMVLIGLLRRRRS